MQRSKLLIEGMSTADVIPVELLVDAQPTNRKTYQAARYAALAVRPGNAERENSKVAQMASAVVEPLHARGRSSNVASLSAPASKSMCLLTVFLLIFN